MAPTGSDTPSRSDPRYVRPPDDAYQLGDNEQATSYRQHQSVSHVITRRLVSRVTGRNESGTVYGVSPDRQYFAGIVASQYDYRESKAEGTAFQNFAQDVAPFRLGVKFRVPQEVPDDETVVVKPNLSGYYQRFPTVAEQRGRANEAGSRNDNSQYREAQDSGDSPTTMADGGAEKTSGDELAGDADGSEKTSLLQVFERVDFDPDQLELTGKEIKEIAHESGERTFDCDDSIALAYDEYRSEERPMRVKKSDVTAQAARTPSREDLEDEEAFKQFVEDHYRAETLDPLWSFEISVRVVPTTDDALTVTVSIENTHGQNYPDTEDYKRDGWRAHLFDVHLDVDVNEPTLRPFESTELRDEYQYEGTIHAVGDNCTVEVERDEGMVRSISSETVPTYRQSKYRPRSPVVAPFTVLSGEEDEEYPDLTLESCLEEIAKEMKAAEEDYEAIRGDILDGKTNKAEQKFDQSMEAFRAERARFEEGIRLLKEDEQVRKAFVRLNETFQKFEFSGWRLFQIVFIVMSIPDIVAQAKDETVDFDHKLDEADVIYYPTGGGKTEAYLGLVTFTAFHDRLRGKDFGTTALTKFPLRFLSLQQLQRIANVLGKAEQIRRAYPDTAEGEPFSVGYYVGDDNTPNKLYEYNQDGPDVDNIRKASDDEEFAEELLIVSKCPFCDEEAVSVTGDEEEKRIIHQCENPECPEVQRNNGDPATLPVYITDDEIYRYAPTFVVSTIDKIAIVGMQRRFRSIFGRIKRRCPDHGFSGESQCLEYYECSANVKEVDEVDPPSILIQDELHLLREEFGAFDSHYETFIQEWIRRTTDGQWEMKVVGATATIKGAEHQVEALYRKNTNIFPSPGPRLRQSFYAYEDPHDLGRRMVGAMPRSVTRTFAMNKVHEEYAAIIQDYQNEPEALDQELRSRDLEFEYDDLNLPGDSDERNDRLLEILDEYEVQISYHYSKDNTDLIQRSVRTMINPNLRSRGGNYHDLVAQSMTGETPLDEVRRALGRLESPGSDLDPIHMIIATSMISHGVDIDRFNFIGFFGVPRQTAEYIQSYSRVGRHNTGTVFVLYNPIRKRDQSFYHRFYHYHEYQDLLVEATPLERWAQFALDCTLPGIFAATILQHYDYELEGELEEGRVYNYEGLQEARRNDLIKRQDVLDFILDAYDVGEGVDDSDMAGVQLYRDLLTTEGAFKRVWERCLEPPETNRKRDAFITNLIKRTKEQRGAMRSLRDIDEQRPITPDGNTASVLHYFVESE
jgi:hypothetical protein